MARGGEAKQALLPTLSPGPPDTRSTLGGMERYQRLAAPHSRVPSCIRRRISARTYGPSGVMTMDILDRYLQAIGEYLPAAGKEDTLAELRANLLALIEDREEQLGRPLNEDELVEIIRNHGRPVVVASRYLPQQWLIGPELFPFYRLALRRSLPLVILFYFSAQVVSLLFQDHGRVNIGATIGTAMAHLPGTL